MEVITDINFPKILFIYDHDFLNNLTPIDPVIKYIEILKHIGNIKKFSKEKKLSVHWLLSHPFPSVPFIEAITILEVETLAKTIKYYRFVDLTTSSGSFMAKRNQFLNLFGHLDRQIKAIKDKEDILQLFIIDDLKELYEWTKSNNFGLSLFYNTLFQIINNPNCYLICLSKTHTTDWVDQYGNRKIRASYHDLLRIQAQASQIEIKFQWLLRPPSIVKLKTENKKGTDTIISLFIVPQSFEEFDQYGYQYNKILNYSEILVCDANLGMNENLTFSDNKKKEIIESTVGLIQNYQLRVEEERKFIFEPTLDNGQHRIYPNEKLQITTTAKNKKIKRRSHENDKLINFIKYSLSLNMIKELEIKSFTIDENARVTLIDHINRFVVKYYNLHNQEHEISNPLIEKIINLFYELLGLNQNEILQINNTVNKQEQWLKPFLALFLVTFNNLYSNVKIKIKDNLKVALRHPQIRNWLGKYPVSKIHYNTYDAKKSVVLARKLPYTLNIIHPHLGLSYLRLNQILSKASGGKLEISVTNVRKEEYHISCRLTIPDIEPIISYAIGIQGNEFTPNCVPFLPTIFITTIAEFPFEKVIKDSAYEIWNFKIINIEFSKFDRPSDLEKKSWNKPYSLKLYIAEQDVVIDLNEVGKSNYKWKITHPL